MGLIKKKKTVEEPMHESASLDAAMNELTKQTEALLGKVEGDADVKKPILPKRRSHPVHRGRSFDIIHDPKRTTRLNATLKAVTPSSASSSKSIFQPKVPLLPDHATASYNEVEPAQVSATVEPLAVEASKPAVMVLHPAGALSVNVVEPASEEVRNDSNATAEVTPPAKDSIAQPVSQKALNFTENTQTVEVEEHLDSAETTELTSEKTSQPPENEQPVKSVSGDAVYTSGELYANNLVKEAQPKGFQPSSNSEALAIFDTNDYHPELHDWSKLENKSGAKWVLLLLLVIFAGAMAYFVLSGQTLPF